MSFHLSQLAIIIGVIIYLWISQQDGDTVDTSSFQTIQKSADNTSERKATEHHELDVIESLQAHESDICIDCLISCLGMLEKNTSVSPLHVAAIRSCIELIERQTVDWRAIISKRLSRMGLRPVMVCGHISRNTTPRRKLLLPQAPVRIPTHWNSSKWQEWSSPVLGLGQNAYKAFTIDSMKRIRYNDTNYRSKGILVFSASWCGHCQALAPTLVKLDIFTQGSIPIVIIDPDQDRVMQKMFIENGLPINGFPTIYIMDVDGRVLHEAYQGPRTLEGLYMKTQLTQSCQESCGHKNDVTGKAMMAYRQNIAQVPTLPLWSAHSALTELANLTPSHAKLMTNIL